MRKYTFVLVTFILLFSGPAFGQWDNQGGKADDTAYGVSWDGSKKAATQNALYDIISALGGGHDAITLDANAQNLLTLTDQALGIHTQVANRVYAGPTTGADAVPTFRALVAEDIPTLNQNTTGTAAGLTAQYIDWNAVSGGSSIANKPTLLALGELSTNAYQGDRGKIAYDHSQAAHAPAIDWTADQGATNIHAGNVDTIGALITGYSSGAGTVAATDTILQAFNKLNGNNDLKLNIANSAMTGDATLTDETPTFICNDSDNAAGTCGFFANSSGGANDIIWSFGVEDSTGSSTEYFQIDGVTETIAFLKPVTLPNAGVIRPAASTDGHTFIIQAYGTDGSNNPELKNVITCTNDTAATANNLPECSIDNVDLRLPVLSFDATPDGMDDDKYNGQVIKGRNCGENLTQWDTVRLANDADPWHQADADAAGEFPAIGLVVAACTDGNPAIVLTNGIVRNEGWTGLTPGGKVYLSDSAGGITQTPPATSGDCVQVIGWALSDSEIYFDFSRPYLELE